MLNQTHTNIEIIVVDDGSNDTSKELLETYGEKVKVVFQKNQGVSAARNNGVLVSKGEYLAFLDADDAWFPAKLEKQLQKFAEEPELGLVHVGVEEIDADGIKIKNLRDGLDGMVSHDLLSLNRAVILGGGSGMMIPRKVFDEIGGFDLQLSTSADWDVFYQISRRYKVGFVSDILLKYRMHGANMHGNIARMEREMMIGFEKAFAQGTTANRAECYANLHRTLAGSYFYAGQYKDFIRHTLKSIWLKPSSFGYFARFPLRRMKKNSFDKD